MCFRIAIFLGFLPSVLNAAKVNGIAAIVNQEPILWSQVTKENTLDNLIDEELEKQEAKKLGVYPSETELEQMIQNIMKQNRMTPAQFSDALAKQGTSMSTYRGQLRRQLIKMRIIQNKVKPKMAQSSRAQIQINAEQAVFETQKAAEEALLDPNKIAFESMGKVSVGDLVPEVSKALFSLKESQISRPIKTSRGYLLVRAVERIEIPLEAGDKGRYEAEIENAYKRYVKELRAVAFVERK